MRYNQEYKSRFKILKNGKISLIIGALIGSISLVAAPTSGVVTTGTATISQTVNTTTINQTSNKASINWQSFSVKPNETVNFVQPSSSSITLNRVIGVNKSLIDGIINANGQVFLLNPNGTVFSKGSSVNVGGLVASTLNMSDEDFQNGNYTLSGNSTNSILNLGTITANSNGYVVLAAKSVSNEGLIKATLGNVQLVGASKVTLNINGNSLIKLTIDKGVIDSLVQNKGIIKAAGGEIYLTSQALDTVLNGVVNNTGIIEADSIDTHNGKIVLFAHEGTTTVDGTLSAQNGFIETSGKVLGVKDTAKIKTKTWLLDPVNLTIDSSGLADTVSATTVQNSLSSADVTLQADNDITVGENITWAEATKLTLTADNTINVNATINNTNSTNGGVYFNAANTTDKVVFDTNGKVKVNNVYQLQWMNQALAAKYELGSNIDASATSSWNSGAGFNPIGNSTNKFLGSFDGLGHTISNLFINRASRYYMGLFGYTNTGSTLQNIGLINVNIKGSGDVGGLVGENDGSISNSYVSGNISGVFFRIGGLVGYNAGTINKSYVSAKVNGNGYIGGFVGKNDGSITNSYALGNVNGTNANITGGFVGWNSSGSTITNSYWDIDTTSRTNRVGKNFGTITNLTGVHSSTGTIDAFTQAIYTGFDFTNTWYMIDGETRPFLRSEYSTTISNDHQLQLMTMDLDASYTLANDITYSGDMWSTRGFNPIGNQSNQFTGSFDGLGHTISDLFIDRGTTNFIGLFGFTDSALAIQNIGLVNVDITGQNYTGGLIGWNNLTINNSFTTGKVIGVNSVGGLVGSNDNTIKNSYSTAIVEGNDYIGGLVGYNSRKIENSYATGKVSGNNNVGGLVGSNGSGSSQIINSYATGIVTTVNDYAGGLVGYSNGFITNSYATGHVNTGRYYGGGLVAVNNGGMISNSYWDIDTTGRPVGFSTNSGTITNLTGIHSSTGTINAFTESTYTGFDFTNDWILYDGNTRPLLRTFMTALTVTANDATKTYDGNAYTGAYGLTYSTTPNSNLLGSVSYSDLSGDTNAGLYSIQSSGLYSNQQGYIISYVEGTLTINPKTITASYTVDNKIYDGTTIATTTAGILSGVVGTDVVNFTQSSANFDNKNVGTGKTVTVNSSLSGADSLNYTVASSTTTADITAKSLTANYTANNKVYDGNTSVIVNASSSDIVSGDTVDFNQIANFDTKNAGIGKAVTVNGITLSGIDATNYTLVNNTVNTRADVTAKSLTASYTADNKVYDGNTSVIVKASSSDIVTGDTISFNQLANFNDKNVDTAKTVTVNEITLSGTDATNYALLNNTANTTADITAKSLTANYTANNKIYDGNTNAIVNASSSDIISGDTVIFNQLANFEDENVGINKVVNINSISLSGIDSENYTLLNNTVITKADITHNHIFDKNIKLIKTPIINGTTFNIDNIVQENSFVQMIAPSKIVNKGVKLPLGLFYNEEF